MSNSNAFGERKLFKIYIRKMVYFAFRVLKKMFPTTPGNGEIIFYKATSAQEYSDLQTKIKWFIPDLKMLNNAVVVTDRLYSKVSSSVFLSNLFDEENHVNNLIESEINLNGIMNEASAIVITKFSYIFKFSILRNLGRVQIVDPNFYSYVESITWQDLYFNSLSDEDLGRYHEITRNNFSRLKASVTHRKNSVSFVTGPSFDSYKDFDFSNYDLKIICNSIVKNDEFLEFIGGADILAFADPVFHFGASKYAESFRSCVYDVVRKYKCFVFVPIKALPLILNRAEDLSDFFIGIDYENKNYNFPDESNLFVKDNGNILTNLLIPLGSSLSESVSVFGADGRNKNEKYFWTHSKTAQFNDLMSSAFDTHPSFFRDRDYADYYDQHCKTVKEIFEYGEKRGKVYYSLTPSFIPALHEREVSSLQVIKES